MTDDARDPTDVDVTALGDGQLDRLLALIEEAGTGGRLSPDQVRELGGLLEQAGVPLEADDLDEAELQARVRDAIGIARLLVAVRSNVIRYASRASLRTGARMLQAVRDANSLGDVLDETTDIARDEIGRLGVDPALGMANGADGTSMERDLDLATLRTRGQRLLDRSANVDYEESVHPTYARFLDVLAADEARILRLLAEEGPHPAVDVRDGGLFGLGSELVARDLTMLGVEAGCRHDERRDAYVTNLRRLGLVELRDDPLDDRDRYPVLEAQPHVQAAMDAARRPGPVRRQVRLTPLGVDFCETILDIDVHPAHRPPG